jgi:hypothetical protein
MILFILHSPAAFEPKISHHRTPSDEELFELISIVDTNMSGTIDFAEFLQVMDYQKNNATKGLCLSASLINNV